MTADKRSPEIPPSQAIWLRSLTCRKLLGWGALAIPVVIAFLQVPGAPKLAQALQNSGHIPAFALFSIGVMESLNELRRKKSGPQRGQFAAAFLACMVAGIGVEIIQANSGRLFSVSDLAYDAAGAICGLSAYAYWQLRQSNHAHGGSAKVLPLVCAACLLLSAMPVAHSVAAYANRNARFPVLWEYRSRLDLYFVNIAGGNLTSAAGVHESGTDENGRKVVFDGEDPGNWPGFQLDEPVQDWQQFRWLMIAIENPESERLDLQIRIHDSKFRNQPEDFYLERLPMAAHEHRVVRIALDKVAAGPSGRSMDLGRVAGIVVFGDRQLAGRAFILRRIWLE